MRKPLLQLALQRVVVGVSAVASLVQPLLKTEAIVERPARIVIAGAGHSLVDVQRFKQMTPHVSDISHLKSKVGAEFVLDGEVPEIYLRDAVGIRRRGEVIHADSVRQRVPAVLTNNRIGNARRTIQQVKRRNVWIRLRDVLRVDDGRIVISPLAENSAKAAGVEAAAKTGAYDSVREELIRDTDPRRETQVIRFDTHILRDRADARGKHLSGSWIETSRSARLRSRLRQVIFPSQSIVDCELWRHAPRVLSKQKESSLAQTRVVIRSGEI